MILSDELVRKAARAAWAVPSDDEIIRTQAALSAALPAILDAAAKASTAAYMEYHRLHREHAARTFEWEKSRESGPRPEINIADHPTFIAAAIRALGKE